MVSIDDWLQSVRDESLKQSKVRAMSNTTASNVEDNIVLGPPRTSFASSTAHVLKKDDDRGSVNVGLIRGDGHRGEGRGDLRYDGRGDPRGESRAKKSLRNDSDGWTSVSRGSRKSSFFEDGGKQRQKYNHFTQRRAERPERPERSRPEWMESGLGEKMESRGSEVPEGKDARQHSVEEFEAWKASMRAQDYPGGQDTGHGGESHEEPVSKMGTEEIVDSFQSLWAKQQETHPVESLPQVVNENQRKTSRPSRFSTLFSPAPAKSPESVEPRPAVPPETAADKEAFQRILRMLDGPASKTSTPPPPPPAPAPRRRANPQANQEFLLSLMNGANNPTPQMSKYPFHQQSGVPYGYPQNYADGGPIQFTHPPSAPPGITQHPLNQSRVLRPPPGLNFPPG